MSDPATWQLGPRIALRAASPEQREFVHARKATPEDLEAILAIEAVAHPTAWPRKIFEGELELACSSFWVFEQSGSSQVSASTQEQETADISTAHSPTDIVGFLVFWLVHDEVHILNIAVAPRARRRGIASAVMRSVIEESAKNLASFVTLEVRIHNKAAIALYEALGFVIIGQRPHYYADTGEDALIMSHLLGGA